ncbi:MAG: type II secretion system GspH family protein [Planctomycetes bacterium]|nr:type II secretion system GspH family protein [Planctomycetota bacterium]
MHGHAHRYPASRRGGGGFTLIEVLVAVACIAILMAILMPSLGAARARAREVTCAVRLQQWGLALACYAHENGGVWPHCDGLDRQDPDPNHPNDPPPNAPRWQVADWFGWVDLLPPLIGYERWRDFPIKQHPDQTTFYQCPAGERLPNESYDYNPARNGYFSYAMNSCLELDENAWPPPDELDYPMPSFLDTGKIAWPARVYVLFDQLLDPSKGYGGNHEYGSCGQHCGSYPIAFSARHQRSGNKLGGNILHADGHVQWYRTVWKADWGDWQIGRQQSPPRNDPNWYPYPVRGGGRGHARGG